MRKNLWIALIAVVLIALPAYAGKPIENTDGSLNGVWKVTQAKNKTKDQVYKNIEIDIDGKYATLRLDPNTRVTLRCEEFYDWGYMIEMTGREKESQDMWIVKYNGSNRQPGQR